METAATRKLFVGGNWKSNGSTTKIADLIESTYNAASFDTENIDVVVSPIAIHIASAKALLNKNIQVGAQNMSATGNGAFTGEISGE
jgi:triosephosphate isomerase (TIM)